jgi:23S rRNA (cytidine2498-2'-O)-methyltransferase
VKNLILYCRPGFEKECAAEVMERAAAIGVHGFAKATPGTGYVIFTSNPQKSIAPLVKKILFTDLIFCRQMFAAFEEITGLPDNDRVHFIIEALRSRNISVSEVFVETADTDESKRILPFCRSFSFHFTKAVAKEGWINSRKGMAASRSRLHLFFLTSDRVWAGISDIDNSSSWHMGIPRLKFPHTAPSRSTLKLEEAFHVFLPKGKASNRLVPGMIAVDLGASPGGWTYQFISRGIRVIAVDNGLMSPILMRSGLVEHVRADGFHYAPPRPADWMVCDIVEQPVRIAKLIGRWIGEGWCRSSIFNLKLPMKKRYDEVKRCMGLIRNELERLPLRYFFSVKHLYHDREEVTGYVTAERK